MSPLVSVVIPTYNRYKYLKGCIESLIDIKSDCIEFVIHDNTHDNSEITEYLSKINDPRVKYFHLPEHVSVMENSDIAVGHANGDYVIMIGDDDTVCGDIVEASKYCKENGIDACCFYYPGYNWYDMTFEAKKRQANLFFRFEADNKVLEIDTLKELREAVVDGGTLPDTLPKLYHGLVSRECLNRVYAKTGTFFPGPSPDMANAVPVCLEAKKTVYFHNYLMVSGYGHDSARGEGNRGQHYGKLDEKPWLPKDIIDRWNEDIPAIFSAETIEAQTMLEALSAMKANELLKDFGFDKVYAVFYLHHKDARKELISFCLKKPSRIIKLICGLIKRYADRRKYLKNNKGFANFKEYEGVETLLEARRITESLSKFSL